MSSTKQNTAIWANETGAIVVEPVPVPAPGPDELHIEVLYSGVNPTDLRTPRFFGCTRRVLGQEFCGRVLRAPAPGQPFSEGDVVAGYTEGGKDRPLQQGTHQSYISLPPQHSVFRVPGNVPHADAATLTVAVMTANDALYNRFGLPLPSEAGAEGVVEGTLVVWGGSTSVGMAAIQLARASGVRTIVATASPARHELLKRIGATECFDYKDDAVVEKVKSAIAAAGAGPVWGFDAAGVPGVSQKLLSGAVPDHGDVRLATVFLVVEEDERFEVVLGSRHYDVEFDIPGREGGLIRFPARPAEQERMWEALMWVLEHYGAEYQALPVRVYDGPAEGALEEIAKVADLGTFGKVVLKLPFC
ncbi:hypothetical protein CkaCkLH20_02872 [Colletotrichum karsti]|uniref:Enoyl reductase (ER) domain-containing protein n=1 Tax=Colletotrichum karsti TaxID=1095194 RepID=A0A9P6LKF1_9PEZI|nr:uncharacterized protein CkaCkLH20_02872 [Colletotrichum karsti]KAF9879329.1 hypothetical protein CkaCkLH20_02872 [Colletotrichum karsti]